MGNKKLGGIINKIIVGKEKSEGYARASLPSNRWELFWDIFKGRFWKLIIINLLVGLFFIPLFLLIFVRSTAILNYGTLVPYSQGFGVGFGSAGSLAGYNEQIIFSVNLSVLLLLPVAIIIAMVGVAGGAYVIRNMVWTEGIFVSNDFWRGIKQNIKQLLIIGLIYSLILYVTILSYSIFNQYLAMGVSVAWLLKTGQVLLISFLAFFSIMTAHMITMSVNYELSFFKLLRNSFLFTVGLLPQNILFLGLSLLFFLPFLFGGIIMIIGIMLAIFLSFSMFLLVWTNYCQWGYDKYINDKVPGAQKNRGIYEKIKESDSGALKKYKEQIALTARSSLNSRPIKPITDDEITLAELPTSFTRSDIEKLNESKKAMIEDNERYIEEHKNDERYQPTEEEKEMEKERLAREKRIEQAKKELKKRKK